jgi:hypothetical protein
VATVATEFKRAFLRNAKWNAEEQSSTLYAQLKAALRGQILGTQSGKVIKAASGNGHSVEYEVPQDFSPQSAAELGEELITRWEAAVTALGLTASVVRDNSASDDDILTEMLALLEPVTEVSADFSQLRCVA